MSRTRAMSNRRCLGILSGGLRSRRPGSHTEVTLRSSRGFSYLALLAAITIIGISMGAAGKYWQNVTLRDKEEELLFRGGQYRQAIQRYMNAIPGRVQYPESLEQLLKDDRSPQPKRHLRQQFKDPITGQDFVEIRDQLSKRIIGVRSSSDKEPLKKSNFPEEDKDFEGKSRYSEWVFQFTLEQQQKQMAPQPKPAQH